MSKAVLITGVAGFIGSRLADYLIDKGYTVYGVDNLSQGLKEHIPSKVIFSELDITTVKSEDLSHLEKEARSVFSQSHILEDGDRISIDLDGSIRLDRKGPEKWISIV